MRDVVLPLGRLNVVTGANGTGKSNLYRALRLLSDTARGGVIASLAREGGFESILWAGPETLSRRMKSGEVPVQGGPRREPVSLRLGFCDDSVGCLTPLAWLQHCGKTQSAMQSNCRNHLVNPRS
jgi:predicted ATPase